MGKKKFSTVKICCSLGRRTNAHYATTILNLMVKAIFAKGFIFNRLVALSSPEIHQGKRSQSNYRILF